MSFWTSLLNLYLYDTWRKIIAEKKEGGSGFTNIYISIYLNALTYSVAPEGQKIKITVLIPPADCTYTSAVRTVYPEKWREK